MSGHLAAVRMTDAWPAARPVYRSIVAFDLEGSTKRGNVVKGELRRVMYDLLGQALKAAGVGPGDLEEPADRGDGVLILIRPHDDVPKTALLGKLIPVLAGLLAEHNATVCRPELALRMRAVVHAGEVHDDGRGFYGDDIDIAFRLLNAPTVKRMLREAASSPLVLVISEEIFTTIIRHGYLGAGGFESAIRVRVGERLRRGRVHIPVPATAGRPAAIDRAKDQLRPVTPLSVTAANGHDLDPRPGRQVRPGSAVRPSAACRRQRARRAATSAGMTWCRSPTTA